MGARCPHPLPFGRSFSPVEKAGMSASVETNLQSERGPATRSGCGWQRQTTAFRFTPSMRERLWQFSTSSQPGHNTTVRAIVKLSYRRYTEIDEDER